MKDGRPRAVFKAKSTSTTSKGPARIHQVIVWSAEDDKKLHVGNVKVLCDCEFFCFTCEYALAKKGASVIHFCNGERPEITNPRLIPTPCKHVLAALNRVIREKDNL